MLQVIFLILKIIGIVLLIILGLLLLMLLTVLLVPIRYRVLAEHGKDLLQVDARASWLLHLLRVKVTHIRGILHIQLKIFCFTLFDNLRPKKPKEMSEKKVKKVRRRKRTVPKAYKKATNTDTMSKQASERLTGTMMQENKQEVKADSKTTVLLSPSESLTHNDLEHPSSDALEPDQRKREQYSHQEHQSLLQNIISRIKRLKDKIIDFFKEWKIRLKGWFTAAVSVKDKIGKINDFIQDELNKQGFRITYTSLKKILKHILPTKLKSQIIFGTGDPCSTGQALGAMSILYSFYGDKIQIIPDFENEILEGKHYARGRIRLVTILIIVIKLILDKRFKQLGKNIQILKEAL